MMLLRFIHRALKARLIHFPTGLGADFSERVERQIRRSFGRGSFLLAPLVSRFRGLCERNTAQTE